MDRWDRDREVEKVKPKPAPASKLTADDAKAIAAAINGALGLALAKLMGSYGDRGTPIAPASETWARENKAPVAVPAGGSNKSGAALEAIVAHENFEDLYQRIKRRLIDECRVDPILLHLLTTAAPELRIDVEPRVLELSGVTMKGRLARLIGSGWFDAPRATSATRKELARTGTDPGGGGTLLEYLNEYVALGFLTREGDGYQKAPGVKVTENDLTVV